MLRREGIFPSVSSHPDVVAIFRDRSAEIQSRITSACQRVNRDPSEVRLIWVSKNHPQERLIDAYVAGARLFGENRVQEVLEKFPLPPEQAPEYGLHLIGHLQRNKVRKVLPLCTAIHSINSVELWEAVDRIAGELQLRPDVFLQVNTSQETQKSGFEPAGFLDAVAALPEALHLNLMGLMTMGPVEGGAEAARCCFRQLRELLEGLRGHAELSARFPNTRFLSMGMSGDFEVAVEEGAHFVRIGTSLFGSR
ncbi:MAG TPA: YggS family pyridoxal phosphate-dependent enzyme [Fibrobacteres bacterium]|nr:YggS family pyridoxal phosphate-dependent enzyme [Fibrobacterota bacterium]